MHFQVFHPYLATLCILRHGFLFEYTYVNEWLELLLKHDSRAVFVSNKNRPAGAKLSKLGSALLQQVPTGATSTVSTVENGKGTAAGLKLEVNSCSFEGWRLSWSVNHLHWKISKNQSLRPLLWPSKTPQQLRPMAWMLEEFRQDAFGCFLIWEEMVKSWGNPHIQLLNFDFWCTLRKTHN